MKFGVIIMMALAAAGHAAAAAPTKFEGKDLFSLQNVTGPQIRPDGREVAYVRVAMDIMTDRPRRSIWLVDTKRKTQIPLDTGPGSVSSPRWSPDGSRLAYIVNDEGRSRLFVRWMQTGKVARITDLTDPPKDFLRSSDGFQWSPDGKSIAFISFTPDEESTLGSAPTKPDGANWLPPLTVITLLRYRTNGEGYLKPGYSHVFVVPAEEGGHPRQLTFGAFDDTGPAWTSDGKFVLFSSNRFKEWKPDSITTYVYQVSVADQMVSQLNHLAGPAYTLRVSPDGKRIAYLGYEDRSLSYRNVRVHIMNRDGSNDRSISDSLDISIDDAQWAADGRSLFVLYTQAAITKVARLMLDGSLKLVVAGLGGSLQDRPYALGGQFSVASNGTVAFVTGSSDAPGDLSMTRGADTARLTQLNDNLFANKKRAQTRYLTVRSSVDQRPIDAWLMTPPDFDSSKKYPLILEIHGGPLAAYGPGFSTDFQLYAAAGYVVLYANPRGSTSYGEEFANLIYHDYPSQDFDDLMSAVDAAIATGFVNPDQLFVTGGSGGGILTAWIVGRTHRFLAAATDKPVINWSSFVLTSAESLSDTMTWFGKLPWEDPALYWKYSPLSLVGNVTTPTLVVVGSMDYQTPVSEAEQYYAALQFRGVPTALVMIPGASHSGLASRPSQSAAKVSAVLAWFDRYRLATKQSARARSVDESTPTN